MTVLFTPRSELLECFAEVADSNFLTEGRFVRLFEDRVSEWADQCAVAVNSCGSGLFAVMRQFPPSNVIVPVNTFPGTAMMVREAGHELVLADCAPDDFAMGLDQIIAAYDRAAMAGKHVGIVVLTHVGWLAKEYEEIAFWCRVEGITLIEDAAHVLGAKRHYRNGKFSKRDHTICAGQFGTAAVFSLYPTKAVPAGEGGCVVTHDLSLAGDIAEFRNYGKKIDGHGEICGYGPGFNLRMDEWTAAVAAMQMHRLAEIEERRTAAAADLVCHVPLHPAVPTEGTMWYKFPVPADVKAQREAGKIYQLSDQVPEALGMHGSFTNAEAIAAGHKCLPIGEEKPNIDAILGRAAA